MIDYLIEWMFEKIFDAHFKQDDMWQMPFDRIHHKLFNNHVIHEMIATLTKRPIDTVRLYLQNLSYIERFLKERLNSDEIKIILNETISDEVVTERMIHIALVNNRMHMIDGLIDRYEKKLNANFLMYTAELSLEDMYFLIRKKGVDPNISVLRRAVSGISVRIIEDCLSIVAPTHEIIEIAFQHNNSDILKILIDDCEKSSLKISNNMTAYVLANGNYEILNIMDERGLVNWHIDLYYSAILSGSEEMIQFVEMKIPTIHCNHQLDLSNSKKGRRSHLLDDIIYKIKDKNYFAHTMNYAVQSGSLKTVKYIRSLGYGIALTNIISAVSRGYVDILEFLLNDYHRDLPFYLIHYLGITHYNPNKVKIAEVLYKKTNIFSQAPSSIKDYQMEKIHLDIIHDKKQINEDTIDTDYIMKHDMYFNLTKPIHYRIVNKISILLRLGADIQEIIKMYSDHASLVADVIYLFGDFQKAKSLSAFPNIRVVAELFCRFEINKLLLLKNQTYDLNERKSLRDVVVSLNDKNLTRVYEIITE